MSVPAFSMHKTRLRSRGHRGPVEPGARCAMIAPVPWTSRALCRLTCAPLSALAVRRGPDFSSASHGGSEGTGQLLMCGHHFRENPDGNWAAGLSQPSAKP